MAIRVLGFVATPSDYGAPAGFIGPTLEMIGYDSQSYNAGVAAGQQTALDQAGCDPGITPNCNGGPSFLSQHSGAIVAAAAALLLLAVVTSMNR
ncbi:MAG TPA: hypothetical protein VFA28_01930 [Bryobacteraceae bacterium]|jgi:hypothetical protein|nr:hypothetical protein [Bryobacteraceae bacterium]